MPPTAVRTLYAPTSITLAAFVRGESHVFDNVDAESISYFQQGDVWFLRFRTGVRDTVVPHVDYWTEEA